MKVSKPQKWFIAGIKTWRITVELENRSNDKIVFESWGRKQVIELYNNFDTALYRNLNK